MQELVKQSLHYNREMTRIHREIAELRSRMQSLAQENSAPQDEVGA